ncbi:MAG: arylesterase [Proteobacteria bacterium]|nr:arylesterase [Pseudomonadota bacterium]
MKNHWKYVLILCLLYVIPCLPCQAHPVLLVVGDSLSAAYQIPPEDGWVSLLENKLKKTYPNIKVVNSSTVGDTTGKSLEYLPDLLNTHHPDIVILELGGNDGLRGLSVQSIRDNLSKMIELSLNAKAKVLLIGIRLPPNYGKAYTEKFYENYSQLAQQYHIALAPFLLENVALNPKLLFEDRIHPTREAQPILVDNVYPYLVPLLPANP